MSKIFSVIIFLTCCINADAAIATIVPAPPKLNASSYLIMDYNSGQIVVSEDIDKKVEPASLTKMMTVYVTGNELHAGHISLDDKVLVSEKAWRMPGSRMFIEVDKEVSVEDLLKGVIIQSGNDASVALAEYVSGSEEVFVQLMNQHAKILGMKNTNYVNSTGLPHENHYTTARDLAILAKAMLWEDSDIYAWHAMKEFTFNGIKQNNRNQLLWRDESVDGIKTGHTDSAGYCLVASAKRGDMRLISVVMGTNGQNERTRATQSLLNYAFRFYETHKIYNTNVAITTSKIWKGAQETIGLGIVDDLYVTVPRGSYDDINAAINIDPTIIAPVNKGELLGSVKIIIDGKELANRSLVSIESVGEGSFFNRLKDDVKLLFQ